VITGAAEAAAISLIDGTLSIDGTLTVDPNNAAINMNDGLRLTSADALVLIAPSGHLIVRRANDDAISLPAGQVNNMGMVTLEESIAGIYDEFSSDGTFVNEGKIIMQNFLPGGNGMTFLNGTFVNEYCGLITSDDNLTANNVENRGVILYTADQISTLGTNTSTGIVHNLGGDFFNILTNNGQLDANPAANYWRGCGSQAWTDDCNWSQDREPTTADSVVVLPGERGYPELSSVSDAIMHIYVSDSLVIMDGGQLNIDGTPATTPRIGAHIDGYLHIQEGGSLVSQSTTSHGIRTRSEIINDGDITISGAPFSAIKVQTGTPSFINNGNITIDNGGHRGIEVLNGKFTNSTTGVVDVLGATSGMYMDNTGSAPLDTIDNYGELKFTNCTFSAIELKDFSSGNTPSFFNQACATITTDNRLFIKPNTEYINSGLINYDHASPVIEGSYTDNGYQYDPNDVLPNSVVTIEIDAPRSQAYFNMDIDGDGMTFCEGDTDDTPIMISCGETLLGETNAGGPDNLNGYPCRPFDFSGPERLYAFDVVAPDTLILVDQLNRSTSTDLFILTDPSDPTSCVTWNPTNILVDLSPGRYYIVVDGFGGLEGSYDLSLRCFEGDDSVTPIPCNSSLLAESNDGTLRYDTYGCFGGANGFERLYSFEVTAPDTLVEVRIENILDGGSVLAGVFSNPEDPNSCLTDINECNGTTSNISAYLPGTYYIFVDSDVGIKTYDISVNCYPIDDAITPISCGQTLSNQDNRGTNRFVDYNCSSFLSFKGTERMYSFEVIAPDTLVTLLISNRTACMDLFLLSDPDDSQSCLVSSDDLISINLDPGIYYVAVDGFNGHAGNFDITLNCFNSDDPGISCSSAIEVICGQAIEGSLEVSAIDLMNNQGCNLEQNGLWYQFEGTGDTVVVSLCGTEESFDSELAILTGSCGTLTCTGTQNDDACGLLSEVTLPTTLGETYWIHVTHIGGNNGDFTMTIACQDDAGCISQRLESGALGQSVYTASDKIISDGSIASPNMIRFSAPEVELLPEFEVSDGELEVDQEGCP